MNNSRKYTQTAIISLLLTIFVFCNRTQALSGTTKLSDKAKINLLVVHSFEASLLDYQSFNKMMNEYWKDKRISINTVTFYLDCDAYNREQELERAKNLLDTISVKPDIILLTEDQATYSILATKHPLLKNTPIVFTGVNFPNHPLYKQYSNLTGLLDQPDYTQNVNMIERIMGVKRIRFFYDKTYNGKQVVMRLSQQIQHKDPKLFHKLNQFILNGDSIINEGIQQGEHSFLRGNDNVERPFKSEYYLINMWDGLGRNFMWHISGNFRHSVFLVARYDYSTANVGRIASVPTFAATNKGFRHKSDILGGYFTTLEDQVEATCNYMLRIINGESPASLPYLDLPKKQVIDWQVMQRWSHLIEQVPNGIEVQNMPFYVRYKTITIVFSTIVITLVFFLIFYLLFLYRRESKRKRQAQMLLWEEKEFLSLAMEGSNIFAWRYNNDSSDFRFDREFIDTVGMKSQVIQLDALNRMTHPEDVEQALSVFFKVARGKGARGAVRTRVDFNGRGYVWYEFRFLNIRGVLGDESSVIGLIMDIQDFKEKEQELIAARDLASKAELKQSFLANMSHEIRTPLNAIVGFSNMLASDSEITEEEKQEYIHIINLNCELLLKLINDILEISRLESGNVSLSLEPCCLNELVKDVYDMCSIQAPANVEFIKHIADEQILVITDIMRMKQVLVNFLSNAFKFTAKGHVKIGLTIDKLQNEISIFVEDTGAGISEENQKMIFERFYKVDEFAQGTGLGLSICQVIIARLNGRIELSSKPNEGSRFTIVLPYKYSSNNASNSFVEHTEITLDGSDDSERPVVLVAEDSASNYLVINNILKKYCTLIWAINGINVLDTLRNRKVDLVLMDIKMHEMDGFTALNKLRKKFKTLPVIIQTAYADEENKKLAKRAGASGFIAKPLSPEIVLKEVARFIPLSKEG